MTLREMYLNLEESLTNLERAIDGLNSMRACGVPARGIAHMAASVTYWQNEVASFRYRIQNGLTAEGEMAVAS